MEYDPASYELQADPFPVYRWLRDEAPVYRNERHGFVALSRFEDVLGAMTRPDVFSSRSGPQLEASGEALEDLQELMIGSDPPRHTELRKLVSRAFTPRRVAELEPFVRRLTGELLEELAGGNGDWVASVAAVVPASVITTLMGFPPSYRDDIRSLADRLLHREPGQLAPSADAEAAGMELYSMLADLVRQRRANPGDDMASALTQVEELDDHQIAMFYVLLAVAGYETTAKLLANLVVELQRHPEQRRLVVDDRALVPATVEESLRYDGPAHYQLRITTQPVSLHGTTIDAGQRVVLVAGAANRDEREFADPDAFDVRRQAPRHLALGHGIHFCLGASLARLEGAVVLDELLARHPDHEVDLDNVERRWSSNFRGLSKVPIALR